MRKPIADLIGAAREDVRGLHTNIATESRSLFFDRGSFVIGLAEVIGGAVGLLVTFVAALSGLPMSIAGCAIPTVFFLLSIQAGWLLLTGSRLGRNLSVLVQSLQVMRFASSTVIIVFVAGLEFGFGIVPWAGNVQITVFQGGSALVEIMRHPIFSMSPEIASWTGGVDLSDSWAAGFNFVPLAALLVLLLPRKKSETAIAVS